MPEIKRTTIDERHGTTPDDAREVPGKNVPRLGRWKQVNGAAQRHLRRYLGGRADGGGRADSKRENTTVRFLLRPEAPTHTVGSRSIHVRDGCGRGR